MEPTRLERLTERERAYLRLVYNAMSSKEIALRYRVEPGTVDKALKSAMAKLGTSSRRTAARMLADAEQGQKLAPQPEDLEQPMKAAIMQASDLDRDWSPISSSREAVREEQVPYVAHMALAGGVRLPIPRHGGDRNDLTLRARLLWIGVISLGIVAIASSLIAIAWGSVRIARQLF